MATTSVRFIRGRVTAAVGILLLGAGLAACGSGDDGQDAASTVTSTTSGQETVTVTQSVGDAPAPTSPAPTSPSTGGSASGGDSSGACSELTGYEAVDRWAGEVPPKAGNYPWAPDWAATDGYDSCADLSWIILPIEGGTASSPYQIMLFHDGAYLGTATSEAYGFYPTVSRVDDATISVTWRWPRDGESNAGASGESTAQFTWDAPSGSVAMSGEVPPV